MGSLKKGVIVAFGSVCCTCRTVLDVFLIEQSLRRLGVWKCVLLPAEYDRRSRGEFLFV